MSLQVEPLILYSFATDYMSGVKLWKKDIPKVHVDAHAHDLIGDKVTEEASYSIGSPSYKDLVEENAYLRSERSQLYDELARVSQADAPLRIDNTRDKFIEALEHDLEHERNQNIRLVNHFEYLKIEVAHLLSVSTRHTCRSPTTSPREKEKEKSLKVLYYREYKRKPKNITT